MSVAWQDIERFRHELVANLFLQRGPFWEAIREAREILGVSPVRDVPSPEYRAELLRHNDEALRIHHEQIPEAYRRWFSFDWLGFLDMCIDFDPPGDRLVEFAAFSGGPFEARLVSEGRKLGPVDDLPSMIAPPIKLISVFTQPGLACQRAKGDKPRCLWCFEGIDHLCSAHDLPHRRRHSFGLEA